MLAELTFQTQRTLKRTSQSHKVLILLEKSNELMLRFETVLLPINYSM